MQSISVESLIKVDVEVMRDVLGGREKGKKIEMNKDREVLNRLNFLRLFLVFLGGLMVYPVYMYFSGYWFLIPTSMLVGAIVITIPIQLYRKKYNLHKYEDIVAFFDEKYNY